MFTHRKAPGFLGRYMTRPCLLTGLAAAAVLGLSACSAAADTPQVASLGNSTTASSGNATAAGKAPTGNPAKLLDEWAACMRKHGDTGQSDPTITAAREIDITMPPSVPGGYDGYSGQSGAGGPGLYCRSYLTAAQAALNSGQVPTVPFNQAKALKYSECMRATGITDFPDPKNGGLSFNINSGSDLNPDNPTFQRASKLCAAKTGGGPSGPSTGPGQIELDGGTLGPGGTGPGANG